MLRWLLGKVEDGRYGRALAGLQAGWQWECEVRRGERVDGLVLYGNKRYRVAIERRGTRCAARCSCDDAVARGVLCKHIAFAAMIFCLIFYGTFVALVRPLLGLRYMVLAKNWGRSANPNYR